MVTLHCSRNSFLILLYSCSLQPQAARVGGSSVNHHTAKVFGYTTSISTRLAVLTWITPN